MNQKQHSTMTASRSIPKTTLEHLYPRTYFLYLEKTKTMLSKIQIIGNQIENQTAKEPKKILAIS
uniref:Putative ovule protein n=1 Tax=Solanum chacoense TaxID=4108 RepID=A0A0V0H322_SOLCH